MNPYRPIMDAARIVPPELQRTGLFGTFAPPVEVLYKQWFMDRIWPATRVILWISVAVWATTPFVLPHVLGLDGSILPARVTIVSWGVGLPAVLAAVLMGRRRIRMWMQPAVLTVTALCALVGVYWTDAANTPNLIVSTTVFFMFIAPILQFPVKSTAFVVLMTVPLTVVVAIVSADRDGTWNGTLNYQLWLLGSTSLVVLGISLAIENSSRGRFIDEQVIARQQEELLSSRA
ncbi:MAG: hypothetical protein QOJ72_2366, partial [Nocardioidaceae bacterium]|nr:hypothetical protein [Nocardioidaceae bacterium]